MSEGSRDSPHPDILDGVLWLVQVKMAAEGYISALDGETDPEGESAEWWLANLRAVLTGGERPPLTGEENDDE